MDASAATAAAPAAVIVALRELPAPQRLLGLYEYGLDGCDQQSAAQVRAVLQELIGSLDFSLGEVTEGFARVYEYCISKTAEADFGRVAWVLRELRDTLGRAVADSGTRRASAD